MNLSELATMSPPEAASTLLTLHKGVQRSAEVYAWDIASKFEPSSTQYKFFTAVIGHICFGGEYPEVERKAADSFTQS
jgi:hypothetical protein